MFMEFEQSYVLDFQESFIIKWNAQPVPIPVKLIPIFVLMIPYLTHAGATLTLGDLSRIYGRRSTRPIINGNHRHGRNAVA